MVAKNSANGDCCNWIKARLRDCQENHPSCTIVGKLPVPRRVLDIEIPNKPDSIRLKTWDHERSPDVEYTALSHCWGPPGLGPTTTTNANIAIRENGIDVSDLSKTVQDAVFVARSLGIRYLWVDALCIIQDDESDWATQSMQMASIYKQALLTIVASCAPNSSTGFLRYRYQNPIAFHTYSFTRAVSQSICIRPFLSYPSVCRSITIHWQHPIHERAWKLQERLLSSRTVFYNVDQLIWECQSCQYLECSTLDMSLLPVHRIHGPNSVHDIWESLRILEGSRFIGPAKSLPSTEQDYHYWYVILAEFKRRKLTYAVDALPAMSGLAHEFGMKLNDRYLAGIGQNDMCRSLSWHRYPDPDRGKVETQPQSIMEIFAPSWSWASVPDECSGTAWTETMVPLTQPSRATFRDADILGTYNDPLSRVQRATLRLEGLCRHVTVEVRNENQSHPFGQYPGIFIFTVEGFEPIYLNQWVRGYMDHPKWLLSQLRPEDKLQITLTLDCLLLAAWKNEENGIVECHCLLLREVDKQFHTRYGLLIMKIDQKRWSEYTCIREGWNGEQYILFDRA